MVDGIYARETVSIADASLKNFTIGLADEVQVSPGEVNGAQYGIMGVSFEGEETGACPSGYAPCNGSYIIPTVPGALYDAGHIGSRSYSLYLDDIVEQKGSILFGAVDTAKFYGDLVTMATIKHESGIQGDGQAGQYVEQGLYLTSFAASINGTKSLVTPDGYSNPILLDSGAASITLPRSVFNALSDLFPSDLGFVYQGAVCVYCDQSTYNFTMTFGFTGADNKSTTVDVPFRELLVPYYTTAAGYNSTTIATRDGRSVCRVNIGSGPDGQQLTIGDPLLRAAYVFYNLDEKTISIAQPTYFANQEKIVPVGQGPTPSFTGTGVDSIREDGTVTVPASATNLAATGSTSGTPSPSSSSNAAVMTKASTSQGALIAALAIVFGIV